MKTVKGVRKNFSILFDVVYCSIQVFTCTLVKPKL